MKLDLDVKLDEGVWAEFDDDVSFKIRCSTPDYIKKSRKKHTKIRWKANQKVEDMNTKEEANWTKELWDHIIQDWKGIEIDKVPAECSADNKDRLIKMSGRHANFIQDFSMDIDNYRDKEQQEKEVKNLPTSSTTS